MEIMKYKKLRSGRYELTLSNNSSIELYEDAILKYNLLISKNIDNLDEIVNYNTYCHVYYEGLKYLKTRARSKKEVHDKLLKNEYSVDMINDALEKLEKQGYINDKIFATSYLNNKLITTTRGPFKIRKELQDKGINNEIIDEVLTSYTEDIQIEKINKIINRMIKSNRNKGTYMLKRKIQSDLIIEGFDKRLIDNLIGNTEFPDDSGIYKKEYDKLYKKLSNKYSGSELEFKIKQKLYQKGLRDE